jgi:hypothetical protein
MTYTDNPIGELALVLAHAEYEGFSIIEYDSRDWEEYRRTGDAKATVKKTRRHTTRDFSIIGMFPQTWGSTALGHGGIGGASVSTAYTVVLSSHYTGEYLVYFGGQIAYTVLNPNNRFWDDLSERNMSERAKCSRYTESEIVI